MKPARSPSRKSRRDIIVSKSKLETLTPMRPASKSEPTNWLRWKSNSECGRFRKKCSYDLTRVTIGCLLKATRIR